MRRLLVWHDNQDGILVVASASDTTVGKALLEELAMGAKRQGLALPIRLSASLPAWQDDSAEPDEANVVVCLLSRALLSELEGVEAFERHALLAKGRQVTLLPVRLANDRPDSGVVELALEEFGVSGVADLVLRRVQARLNERAPRLSADAWPELDGRQVDAFIERHRPWSARALSNNLAFDVSVPHDLRHVLRTAERLLRTSPGDLAATSVLAIVERADEEHGAAMRRGVAALLAARAEVNQDLRAASEAIELLLLGQVGALASHLAHIDLVFDGVPPLVETLRQSASNRGFLSGLVAAAQARGWGEDFWVDAGLEDKSHRHPVFIPGSCVLEAAARLEPIAINDRLYAVLAAQFASTEARDTFAVRCFLAFPERSALVLRGTALIDARTGQRGRPKDADGALKRRSFARLEALVRDAYADRVDLRLEAAREQLWFLED